MTLIPNRLIISRLIKFSKKQVEQIKSTSHVFLELRIIHIYLMTLKLLIINGIIRNRDQQFTVVTLTIDMHFHDLRDYVTTVSLSTIKNIFDRLYI